MESDPPAPLNAYGESKLAGERIVSGYERGHIVRTSGIFGASDPAQPSRNFFGAIARKLGEGAEAVRVVDDQVTAVTYAPHLAEMLFTLLEAGLPALVHLTSHGSDSWFGWAQLAAELTGHDPARLTPVSGSEYDPHTPRPAHSVLGSEVAGVPALVAQYPADAGIAAYLG